VTAPNGKGIYGLIKEHTIAAHLVPRSLRVDANSSHQCQINYRANSFILDLNGRPWDKFTHANLQTSEPVLHPGATIMKSNMLSTIFVTTTVLTSAILACAPRATAQTEQVVYTFTNPGGGLSPNGGLILDNAGNIYGVTFSGGQYGGGTVYKLSPCENGRVVESVLHSFEPDGASGIEPNGPLVFDASGNLYGTTFYGGRNNCTRENNIRGCGMVYELIPQPDGTWVEQVLHQFDSDGRDGTNPYAGLLIDAAGNLYGTTYFGGNSTECGKFGCGTVYELTPGANGVWTEKILIDFDYSAGFYPVAALTPDGSGNLYGTTTQGGKGSNGKVFELTPTTTGGWSESILHNFAFGTTDGADPEAGVTFDSSGNLFGTTFLGGTGGYGILYELTPSEDGTWSETIIHNFPGNLSDAAQPGPGKLVFDSVGNLYGASGTGGAMFEGTVFEFTPSGTGDWTERILYSFASGSAGIYPSASVIFNPAGNLYGTTGADGGDDKSVYELVLSK
jgi:uncharacterized repeat protein (TIGR03803 family)